MQPKPGPQPSKEEAVSPEKQGQPFPVGYRNQLVQGLRSGDQLVRQPKLPGPLPHAKDQLGKIRRDHQRFAKYLQGLDT